MTKEQKAKYIEDEGMICPNCGEDGLVADVVRRDPNLISPEVQVLTCWDCKRVYRETWKITDVEEIG